MDCPEQTRLVLSNLVQPDDLIFPYIAYKFGLTWSLLSHNSVTTATACMAAYHTVRIIYLLVR